MAGKRKSVDDLRDTVKWLSYHREDLDALGKIAGPQYIKDDLVAIQKSIARVVRNYRVERPGYFDFPAEVLTLILEFVIDWRVASHFGTGGVVFTRQYACDWTVVLAEKQPWVRYRLVNHTWAAILGEHVRSLTVPTTRVAPMITANQLCTAFPNISSVKVIPLKRRTTRRTTVESLFTVLEGLFAHTTGLLIRDLGKLMYAGDRLETNGAISFRGRHASAIMSSESMWTSPDGGKWARVSLHHPGPNIRPYDSRATHVHLSFRGPRNPPSRPWQVLMMPTDNVRQFWMTCRDCLVFSTLAAACSINHDYEVHLSVCVTEDVEKVLAIKWPGTFVPTVVLHPSDGWVDDIIALPNGKTNAPVWLHSREYDLQTRLF